MKRARITVATAVAAVLLATGVMKRAGITIVAAVTTVLFVTGALTVAAASDDTPPPPPAPEWVNADGSIDESNLPSAIPVIGPDGEDLIDSKGNPVMAPLRAEEPDYEPEPRCPRCPVDPPPVDWGDKHSVETDSDGNTLEVVDVGDDAPFVP
ncbi:hypothetical protein AB0942_25685 [Streptomyces nodosus]|uniref:hypothetical protein n=1 Tax=Streptomyces nodosus TaxID=40318 RepID=UPI00345207D8